jgi:hypothetical protein
MLQKIYKIAKKRILMFFVLLQKSPIFPYSHEVVYLNFPSEISLSELERQLDDIKKRYPKALIDLRGLESVKIIDE